MPVTKINKPAPTSPKRKRTSPFLLFSKYEPERGARNLRFDVNALADFEQETGMGFAQLMKQRAVFASARAMLWAGLKHEDRALTIEQVGNLLGSYLRDDSVEAGVNTIDTILTEAIKAAVDQGALGRTVVVKAEDESEDDEENDPTKKLPSGPNDQGVIEGETIGSADPSSNIPMTQETGD